MSTKYSVFFCLVLNATSALAQIYGWTQCTNSPVTSRSDDIHFIDANIGWAVTGGAGGVWKTTNGGVTWVQKFSQTSPLAHFRSVGFLSATRGFVGNLGTNAYDANVKDTNILYQTSDGGDTWSPVQAVNASGMKGFCAFHVLDSHTIYGGGRVRGPAYFVKSTDAGTNWTIVNLTAMGVMNGIMDVYFKDATNGFVVGMDTNSYSSTCANQYHGRIARTTDGGATWTPITTTPENCCYFWKMSWPSPSVGYVSLQQNTTMTNHVFYKTIDGGNTWIPNLIPFSAIGVSSFYWQGVGFVTTNEGWAGGDSATAPYANNFLHTLDGGATWTRAGYTNSQRINRLRFLNSNFGYASGVNLHLYHLLLDTTQPASQWVTAGVTVNFSVSPSGIAPFAFQWRKDGTNILNATNATLSLTNVLRSNSGTYSVLVSNSSTNLVSSNATLRVLVPQKFQSPQNLGNTVQLLFGDANGGLLTTYEVSSFEVQASTNLSDWTPLTNSLLLTNGLILLEDAKDVPHKFYRVIEH